jgi:hypothetical protein
MPGRAPRPLSPTPRALAGALLLLAGLALTACVSGGQKSLREGTLRPGIGQKAFVQEWGWPDRTTALLSVDQLRARLGTVPPGPLFRDGRPLDVWTYESPGVEVVFDGGDLLAWKTERTPAELRAIRPAEPVTGVSPIGDGRRSLGQGLLRVDIGQKAFRSEWGPPDRTATVAGTAALESAWGPGVTGGILEGQGPLEVWSYDRHGVELLFEHGDLAAWKTAKNRRELRAMPRP